MASHHSNVGKHAQEMRSMAFFGIFFGFFFEIHVASGGLHAYSTRMSDTAVESSLIAKTLDLCFEIANDPAYLALQGRIERFLDDDAARLQYQGVHERGEQLHQKQHAGLELGASEIREFEAAREALLKNDVAREFLEAQHEMEHMQKEISKYISLTFELGHVPSPEELAEACGNGGGGCCGGGGGGGGCGCSH